MNKYTYLLLFLVCFFTKNTLAQDCPEKDFKKQLENTLQIMKDKVTSHEADYSLLLADSLLAVLEKKSMTTCDIYFWIEYHKGEALEINKEYKQAILLYHNLLQKTQKEIKIELEAESYISLARTYELIGRKQECLENLQKARKIIEKQSLNAVFSHFAVRYSSYHRLFDNKDSARIYADIAIQYGEKYNVERSVVDGHLLLGLLSKNDSLSIYHYEKATQLFLKQKIFLGAIMQKLNVIKLYIKNNKLKEANYQLDSLQIPIALINNEWQQKEMYSYSYKLKENIFRLQKNIDSAYLYLGKRHQLDSILMTTNQQKEINQLQIQFAVQKEQQKLQQEQKINNYFKIAFSVLIVVFITFVILFIYTKRQKNVITIQKNSISDKNEELNTSLQQQMLLLSEVHHRVKNNLQLVMSILALKASKTSNIDIKNQLFEVEKKINTIALIHQQLYQEENFEKINAKEYFVQLVHYFQTLQNEEQFFLIDIQIEDLLINIDTILPLGIITTELITNSLKYGRIADTKLSLYLSIIQKENHYLLTYKDNGKGNFTNSLEYKTDGLGKLLVESMTKQLGAKSNSFNDKGSNFTLLFKEKYTSQI